MLMRNAAQRDKHTFIVVVCCVICAPVSFLFFLVMNVYQKKDREGSEGGKMLTKGEDEREIEENEIERKKEEGQSRNQ